MGKGRRRHRRGKNRQQRNAGPKLTAQFNAQSLERFVEDDFAYEERMAKQKEYRERAAAVERGILSRTVFVTSVLDLNQSGNLARLKAFMEQSYGPVQKCEIAQYHGKNKNKRQGSSRPPPARVMFRYERHAERIFGKSLLEAMRDSQSVRVRCASAGYRGFINVKPTQKFSNMVEDEITGSKEVTLATEGFAMGHWFPEGEDAYENMPGSEGAVHAGVGNEWLEELSTDLRPILKMDLDRSVLELDFSHCVKSEQVPLFSFLNSLTLDDILGGGEKHTIATFRVKDLVQSIDLCKGQDRGSTYDLLFSLKQPPRLSCIQIDSDGRESRTRLTGLAGIDGETFGRCLGFRLRVTGTNLDSLLLNSEALEKLHNFGVFRNDLDSLQQAAHVSIKKLNRDQHRNLENGLASIHSKRLGLLLRSFFDSAKCCWYDALNDLVFTADRSVKNLFELANQGDPGIVEIILNQARDMHGKTRYPAHLFHRLYEDEADGYEGEELYSSVPTYCIEIPRLLITPCRECIMGFQVEMSNRIIRKFVNEHGFLPEAFLRVTIGDENGDKLFSDDLNGPVASRIETILLNGLVICGICYRFLAFSSSQLKEESLWMVHPEHGWTVQGMRDSMGDFSVCRTPSKYAARIGQCFSTTVETLSPGLSSGRAAGLRVLDSLPDVMSYDYATDSELCHTDGCGLIRKEVFEDIIKQVPFGLKHSRDVSTIQIRFGGAKGVLAAWDFDTLPDPRCRGFDICLRPSMVKFSAPYNNLEVITVGKHIGYFLNRNVILLLHYHGVNESIFLGMQKEMFQNLNQMLVDPTVASSMVPRLGGFDSGLTSTLMHMLASGVLPDQDPFLFSCLHATRAHQLMNLRKKARIFVEKGAVLIGAIDELGIIPEGHVFVQIQKSYSDDNDGFEPVTGQLMVTKHPVMHPGDVRMLIGIDMEELRGHRNVILFSKHGPRPEPNKMAGSDLDGDQFAVTWDQRLFLPHQNSAPMDYSPPSKRAQEFDTMTDRLLIDHFINHAKSDNLGRIAMLWLDHAVDKDAGCEECLQLAGLHSTAVDLPKSGVPAVIPRELILKRTHPRAHWREKKESPSFHCDSILGRLYDEVTAEVKDREKASRRSQAMASRTCDKNGQILIYGNEFEIEKWKRETFSPRIPGKLSSSYDENLQRFANQQRDSYDHELIDLMNRFKIRSEGEIVTGCILKYHKLHKRRRHDVAEEVRRQFREVRANFRAEFFLAVFRCCIHGGTNSLDEEEEVDEDELAWVEQVVTSRFVTVSHVPNSRLTSARGFARRLAAAYYMATYSPEMHWRRRCVLYSFPWVVAADVIGCSLRERPY